MGKLRHCPAVIMYEKSVSRVVSTSVRELDHADSCVQLRDRESCFIVTSLCLSMPGAF